MKMDDDDAKRLGEDIENQIKNNKILLSDESSANEFVFKVKYKGEEVAVKRLRNPNLSSTHPDYIKFERELKIGLQLKLDHKNVLGLRGIGISENFYYLAMDLCTGSLDKVFSLNYKGPSLPSPILKVLYEIACGVAHLHEKNLIHRDIKPQNILLSKDDPVQMKVADFGCSKFTTPGTGTCSWSGDFGTQDYRSPEYAEWQDEVAEALKRNEPQPERGRISNKIDVFSTGLVFFYVLSRGHHPFGKGALVTYNIATGETVDFDERLQGVSEDVKQLIRRMIDVDPAARPTMDEVKKELEKLDF